MTPTKTISHTGGSSTIVLDNGSTYNPGFYGNPYMVETLVYPTQIEIIYRRPSRVSNNWGSLPDQVYKIIYTISEKSEPIMGEIVPAQPETYSFTTISGEPETC